MKTIKAYLGFLPALLVAVPCGVAMIRQALFYKGCMDGFGFVMLGFYGFAAGGILNVAFLLYAAVTRRRYYDFAERRHARIALAGTAVAVLLLVTQLAILICFELARVR